MKEKAKGFIKMFSGYMLILAPVQLGLLAGEPFYDLSQKRQNEVLNQFYSSPEYEQAVEYRDARLEYINQHEFDESQSFQALENEKNYLNSSIQDKKGFMYAVLKESEYGIAYANALSIEKDAVMASVYGGALGLSLTFVGSLITMAVCNDWKPGAICRKMIYDGGKQAFGLEEAEC